MYLIGTSGVRVPINPTSQSIPRFAGNNLQDSSVLIDDEGNLNVQGGRLDNISSASYSSWPLVAPVSGFVAIRYDMYQAASVTLSDPSTTLVLSQPKGPGAFKLIISQDNQGGRTVVWSSSLDILAPDGEIFLAGDAMSQSLLGLIYTGYAWYIVSSQPMSTIF